MNTLGILGGTFDPIHWGHLRMAQVVMKELNVGRVLVIPDGDPPHKRNLTPGKHRLRMARLAVEGLPGLDVSDMEIARAGTTYTVDTLTQLKKQRGEDLIYIVGSDTLLVIETWRDFPRAASMLKGLAVVPRPGDDQAAIGAQAARLERLFGLRVYLMKEQVSPLSSTGIRLRAARRQSLEGMTPPAVAKYIASHKLYQDPMLEQLRATMTAPRYRHTLGVEETALEMADLFSVDREKARLAALLHDCAKHLDVPEMKGLVKEMGVSIAPGEDDSRALFHAAAGVALARKAFHVQDEEVLGAIRWHTTGRPDMTKLEQVIYLADMIEPGRRPFPGLEEIRALARQDLDKAMLAAARRTVEYVKSRGMPLNERTVKLLNSLEEKENREGIQ